MTLPERSNARLARAWPWAVLLFLAAGSSQAQPGPYGQPPYGSQAVQGGAAGSPAGPAAPGYGYPGPSQGQPGLYPGYPAAQGPYGAPAAAAGPAQPTYPGDDVVLVEVRGVGGTIPVGGTIVPHREVTFTAQFPGRVDSIAGEEGAAFSKGKVLVSIDEEALLAQRRAAAAQIANAEAALRNAGVQYSRERESPQSRGMMDQMMPNPMSSMFGGSKSGVDRRADLYSHQIQIEQSRNALFQAQSQLQELDARLKDTKSVAPFDGVIVHKYVDAGDTVQPGQPLVSFADLSALQVQVDVPARLAAHLRQDLQLEVRLDDVRKTVVPARVVQVFPVADAVRHTVRTKLSLPAGAPAAAGMYAEVLVTDPTAAAGGYPVIPSSSVLWRGGLPYAYVLTPEGNRSLRLLRLGDPADSGHVIVLTGLSGGERILRTPPR